MAQQKVLTIVTLRVWVQIMLQMKKNMGQILSNFSLHVVDIEANMSHILSVYPMVHFDSVHLKLALVGTF